MHPLKLSSPTDMRPATKPLLPEKAPKQKKAVFHPKLISVEAVALREDIQNACSDFEEGVGLDDKGYLRALHEHAKYQSPGFNPVLIQALFRKHKKWFRSGSDIDPAKIKPKLFLVNNNQLSELFAIVRALWSMPYNKGYGRRLRFVIVDEFHESVIGIVGLQSPPADLACRDNLFDYPEGKKLELVNSTMDAYTVGAIPPYSFLLGGKLCAGMISTDTIRRAYWRQYAGKRTEMENVGIRQPLVAVTTTSAFGRSSMYNRLKFGERLLAEPIGFTQGYGTLHLEHLYGRICEYLKSVDQHTEGGFGSGPKVRWQNITNALSALSLPGSLLKHGVKREVFLFRFVDELAKGMTGGSFGKPIPLTEEQWGDFWKERWAIPRSKRLPLWNTNNDQDFLERKLADITRACSKI